MHCSKHRKYKPGCKDCQEKNNEYNRNRRKGLRKTNPETQYPNGTSKPSGHMSEENWKRFNELGRRLTK